MVIGVSLYLQAIIDGLLVGGVYASIAVGLGLSFGVMRIINANEVTWKVFEVTGFDEYFTIE